MNKIKCLGMGMPILGIVFLLGCASVKMSMGHPYNIEKLTSIKIGMSEAEVVSLLGESIAKGRDLDGNYFLFYQYAGGGGGSPIVGAATSVGVSGGETRIIFDPGTHKVKAVKYEIYGLEYYEKLRGSK